MIFIVGCGPYHKDLITLAADQLIRSADCILYDHLINRDLLTLVKPECELVNVGKQGNGPSVSQEMINHLLVEKDHTHDLTIRLKGGDPGIYGRGGEEMQYCLDHGINVQWIPGISALNALGYAGIPLTHRDISSGFGVHTLSYKDGLDHVDYDAFIKSNDTQIFFMGSKKIHLFVQSCLNHGMPFDTPITLADHLTYPDQRVVSTTLEMISTLDLESFNSPLLIVLGQCGSLCQILNNQLRLGGYGKRMALLSIDDASWPIDLITLKYGIEVDVIQVGTIEAMVEPLPDMDVFKGMVFVSNHSVEMFFNALSVNHKDIRTFLGKTIYCIGHKTESALRSHGLTIDACFDDRDDLTTHLSDPSTLLWVSALNTPPKIMNMIHYPCYRIIPSTASLNHHYDAYGVTCPFSVHALSKLTQKRDMPLYCFAHGTANSAIFHGFTNIHPVESNRSILVDTMVNDLIGTL